MKKTGRTTKTKTDYTNVDKNIYQTGDKYRVRMIINGIRFSEYFTSKRGAVIYRNKLKRNAGLA